MPLFKSKSKKAFEHNVKEEIEAGKPQKQSLAIAYNIRRKAPKKKMAEGGQVKDYSKGVHKEDTETEGRRGEKISHAHAALINEYPEARNERKAQTREATRHHKKVLTQLQKMPKANIQGLAEGGQVKPRLEFKSNPEMVKSSVFTTKLKDKHGNPIEEGPGPEEDMLVEPTHLEEDNDEMAPSEEEFMAKKMASGGKAANPVSRPDTGYGAIICKACGGDVHHEEDEQPEHEAELEHFDSMVAAIMAKRRKMAEGGAVDIDENAEEQPNEFYNENEALLKVNYDEDMDSVSEPEDSNEMGDEEEHMDEDKHDMISAIRRKMAVKKAFR